MVGFVDVSDTNAESAIDQIITQAQDACVLEQVSAINCASLTDSVLPTDLESRFHKFKSFPVTESKQLSKTSVSSPSNSSDSLEEGARDLDDLVTNGGGLEKDRGLESGSGILDITEVWLHVVITFWFNWRQ
ncbi:uncharacterized protein LOC114742781 [Neltuma alba]|uniref:uncharacterized protein LOC114742781 n=1 Tax=Neltuma alba TaxID=207710 RepID=UPI0010A3BB5B|nr:uncharacterized protein LOC114742781 [Prosopis alba]